MNLNNTILKWVDLINQKQCNTAKYATFMSAFRSCGSILRFIMGISERLLYDSLYIKHALHYLSLYVNNTHIIVDVYNIKKLFLMAATVAHKFWIDDVFSNEAIAGYVGLDIDTFNQLEIDFIQAIGWKLYIEQTEINDKMFTKSLTIINPNFKLNLQEGDFH